MLEPELAYQCNLPFLEYRSGPRSGSHTYKPETRDSRQRIIPDSNEITDNNNIKVTIYIIW